MTSLLPIGPSALPPVFPDFLSAGGPAPTGIDSFLSFLEQCSDLPMLQQPQKAFDSPATPRLNLNLPSPSTIGGDLKKKKPAEALPNLNIPSAVSTPDIPLPLKLTLNLLATKNDAADQRSSPFNKKKGGVSTDADANIASASTFQTLKIPVLFSLPVSSAADMRSSGFTRPEPVDALPALQTAIPQDIPAKHSDPRLEIESATPNAPDSAPLAFALRLKPSENPVEAPKPAMPEIVTAPAPSVEPPSAPPVASPTNTNITVVAPILSEPTNLSAVTAPQDFTTPKHPQKNSENQQPAIPAATAPQSQPASSRDGNVNADRQSRQSGERGSSSNRDDNNTASVESATLPGAFNSAFHAVHVPNSPHATETAVAAPTPEAADQPATQASAAPDADPPSKTGAANQLSFSVPSGDHQKVEVRVMDHAGEVRVSVRTPNPELARNLRDDLGTLTSKLNQSGYGTESFTPAADVRTHHDPAQASRDPQSNGGEQNADRQGQNQNSRQQHRGQRPAWLEELENSLAVAPVVKDYRK